MVSRARLPNTIHRTEGAQPKGTRQGEPRRFHWASDRAGDSWPAPLVQIRGELGPPDKDRTAFDIATEAARSLRWPCAHSPAAINRKARDERRPGRAIRRSALPDGCAYRYRANRYAPRAPHR